MGCTTGPGVDNNNDNNNNDDDDNDDNDDDDQETLLGLTLPHLRHGGGLHPGSPVLDQPILWDK